MSKRKGLSHEEKRSKMLELFFEKKDFFQLKELERLGPKEKGVISQAVKEIVQSLVDDGVVDTDKIGTCVYFWAFPSKANNLRLNKIKDLEEKVAETSSKLESRKKKFEESRVGREEGGEREAILGRLNEVRGRKQELELSLKKSQDCHPDLIRRMAQEAQTAVEGANRWTDNIFSIKSWCKNKFFIEEATLNKQFNIPEELDNI